MKRISVATIAVIVVMALGVPASAQMKELSVQVDGLICPFCSYGLEKRLSGIDGIDSAAVDLAEGRAVLQLAPGRVPDFHEIQEAVVDSGFTPQDFNVVATGRVIDWNGRLTLVVPEDERFFLNDTEQRLGGVAGTPETVTVRGTAALSPGDDDVHRHPFTITVREVEGVE